MLHTIMKYSQAIIAVLMIITILVQNRSSGLSSTFGGTGSISTTKRGAEKIVFQATIVLAALFVLVSIAFVFVR